jgi:crotonobetainyl-CoA:carnitine CoA-transferase CaiB-like acyl-CoA transferase
MDGSSTKLPLSGVKVLELGSLIAGPYAGSLFAQFGAEVIKIEPPRVGDPLRKWRQLQAAREAVTNHRSIRDLERSPEERFAASLSDPLSPRE